MCRREIDVTIFLFFIKQFPNSSFFDVNKNKFQKKKYFFIFLFFQFNLLKMLKIAYEIIEDLFRINRVLRVKGVFIERPQKSGRRNEKKNDGRKAMRLILFPNHKFPIFEFGIGKQEKVVEKAKESIQKSHSCVF